MAVGASADDLNGPGFESGGEELTAIGFDEVQMQGRADWGVTGGALGEEEHGVLVAHLVSRVDLVEEFATVGELGFEFREDFLADGVAAGADAGADGGNEILRAGTELEPHAADTGLDDALDGAAPSGVEGGDYAEPAVGNQDGNAVGGLDSDEESGLGGDLSVASPGCFAGCIGLRGPVCEA